MISPVSIIGSVQGFAGASGKHVKDVLAAPTRGIRIVLHGAQSPILGARHGIDGNPAQELVFASQFSVFSSQFSVNPVLRLRIAFTDN